MAELILLIDYETEECLVTLIDLIFCRWIIKKTCNNVLALKKKIFMASVEKIDVSHFDC